MLIFAFLLGSAALVLQGVISPQIPIIAFAPVLSLATLKCPFRKALWIGGAAGFTLDLFSDLPMGLHALDYVLSVALLYRFRKHLSYEEPFHFSLFTALFSALVTTVQLVLLFLFDRRVPNAGKWIFADIFAMPAIDALYAFVWFSAPLALYERVRKFWVLFWLKKKNRSQISHESE